MLVSFAQITNQELITLSQSRVSRSAILVYVAISTHLRDLKGSTTAFPSVRRLIALLGDQVSRSAIFRALNELEAANLIKRERKAERRSNTYTLTLRKAIKEMLLRLKPNWIMNRSPKSGTGRYSPTSGTLKKRKKIDLINPEINMSETLLSKFLITGVQDNRLTDVLTQNDWNFLQNRHPQKYELLRAQI